MSRQAHLPPRCPFQKKANGHPIYDPVSPRSYKDIASHPRHHKSVSQSYVKEEQPAWLDDLLDDATSSSSNILHRRSASDTLTLLDDLVPTPSLVHLNVRDTSASCESDGRLESSSMYGPNSPRGTGKLSFPGDNIVLALSKYMHHQDWSQLDEGVSASRVADVRLAEDTCGSAGEVTVEEKHAKRHPGQRSRVRKLQYIAELERTVDNLQQMESDLAARVACLLQRRLSLSVENSQLKQKLTMLRQQKLMVDGQNQTLRNEFEMLKKKMAYGSKKGSSHSGLGITPKLASSETTWQMLDMRKLSLS